MKNSTRPLVYIIILNWNRSGDTAECLESLKLLKYSNYKILLIDNGSTDDSVEYFKKHCPKTELIENAENLGFAAGSNLGIRKALSRGADYVFLLNNDTVVEPDVLDKLVSAAEADERIGMLGPKINHYPRRDVIWSAGGRVILPLAVTWHIGTRRRDSECYRKSIAVGYQPACALLIKKEVIDKIGLLNTAYKAYFEDTDWCLRAKKAGYRVICLQRAKIYHKVSASTGGGLNARKLYWKIKSGFLFFKTHTNLPEKAICLPAAAVQLLLLMAYTLMRLKPACIKAIATALRDIALSKETGKYALSAAGRKRILFVSHSSRLEGAELTLVTLAKKLKDAGYQVYVICPSRGKLVKKLNEYNIKSFVVFMHRWVYSRSYLNKSVAIGHLGLNKLLLRHQKEKLKKLMADKIKPDVLINNTITINQAVLAAEELGVPVIWYIHEILDAGSFMKKLNLPYSEIAEFVTTHSDKIVFDSHMTQNIFEEKLSQGEHRQKLDKIKHILYAIVDFEDRKTSKDVVETIKDDKEFSIGVIGSIFPEKGQLVALKAFRQVAEEFPSAVLKFAGSVKDKRYFTQLKNFIKRHELMHRVRFYGYIDNIKDFILRETQLIIVPSIYEPFGRIALEAIMLGVPVIASDTGGLREIIKSGQNGILVKPGAADDLASALNGLLKDAKLMKKLSRKALANTSEVFKPAKIIDDFINLIENLS